MDISVSVPWDTLEQLAKQTKTIALLEILVKMKAPVVIKSTATVVNAPLASKERSARREYRNAKVVLAETVAHASMVEILTCVLVHPDMPGKIVRRSSHIVIRNPAKMAGNALVTSSRILALVFPVGLDVRVTMTKKFKVLLTKLTKLSTTTGPSRWTTCTKKLRMRWIFYRTKIRTIKRIV